MLENSQKKDLSKQIAIALIAGTLIGCDSSTSSNPTSNSILPYLVDPGAGPSLARLSSDVDYVEIPAKIQAEHYTDHNGIRVGETNDSGGGDFVGWINDGDFTEYGIDVPETGIYKVDIRVASKNKTSTVKFSVNGSETGSARVTPTGSWKDWKTVTTTMELNAGTQTLRLEYTSEDSNGLMDINWLSLTPTDEITTTTPPPVNNRLDSSNWTVYSNNNTDDAFLAIDGNDATRWTTKTKQQNDQEFYIELGSNEEFDRIILDSTKSNDDHPRQYRVEVSTNGSNWTEVAAGTGTSNGKTTIDFADQDASYIKIKQTGSTSRSWWSIHELSVFVDESNEGNYVPEPPVDGDLVSHDFDDGNMGPFVECTTKSPNYSRVENGRIKTRWIADSYDGGRMTKGAEICDRNRGFDGGEIHTRKHGAFGFTINVDDNHRRDSLSGLLQIFAFDNAIDRHGPVGMLLLDDGDLKMSHRYCFCSDDPATIIKDFEYGRDHNIIIEFTLSQNYKGKMMIWVDGDLKYNAQDLKFGTFEFNDNDVQTNESFTTYKLGMYNFEHEDYVAGEERIVYYDNISWYNGDNGYDVVNPE